MEKKYRVLTALVLLALYSGVSRGQGIKYSLDSKDRLVEWRVFPHDSTTMNGVALSDAVTARQGVKGLVPGTVFASYVAAGMEKDPNYGDNIYEVDERKYNRPFWYVTSFRLPEQPTDGQHVWLCFDNINKFADFYFNGKKVSGTSTSVKDIKGHMMRVRLDITDYYHQNQSNTIAVLVYDPDEKKTRTGKDPYGVKCSPSYLAGAGWDWMPYVPGRESGLTGHAYVYVTNGVRLIDPWMRSQVEPAGKAILSFSSNVVNVTGNKQTVTVKGVVNPSGVTFEKTVEVGAGDTAFVSLDHRQVSRMVLSHPRLWWPNGYGDPNLYTCRVECLVGGKVSDTQTFRFGIRKYEYRFEKNRVGYPVLNLYVNGQRIFVKGGNWGMSEYLLRCQGKDYQDKILLHKDMNYNMIRLWTGCVTDDEFYDYCDENGIMVWNDFWLYVAYNDVADHQVFLCNARDKVRRLRNHACIAVWCGANETHPVADIDAGLRQIVMEEDGNDRLYKSCSNQDALSGSGWWQDFPPKHHFSTSASNLAFNHPAYPYGMDYGYGFRTEIGMATFPQYESVRLFIPKDKQWPLPTAKQLKEDDNNIWNHHFFGKEASNANPAGYLEAVNKRYGQSSSLEEFCEKAQLINLEDMKGMYEAWQDKMWDDAAGLLIWMSHPAYLSFVWQTYDYYYDPTGCYWGARKACEPIHVQWNCDNGSVKVVNTSGKAIDHATVTATLYNLQGEQMSEQTASVTCPSSDIGNAFILKPLSNCMQWIRLRLLDDTGKELANNFYWYNSQEELNYTALARLPEVNLNAKLLSVANNQAKVKITNNSSSTAFALRLRLIDKKTKNRVLPVIWSDNYLTLMPGEEQVVTMRWTGNTVPMSLLVKPFHQKEKALLTVK